MAVYGIYYALTQPVLKALIVSRWMPVFAAELWGSMPSSLVSATLGASLITGELWKHYGAGVPFYFSAALALISAGLLLMKTKTRENFKT